MMAVMPVMILRMVIMAVGAVVMVTMMMHDV
jgi:hypothetical protein